MAEANRAYRDWFDHLNDIVGSALEEFGWHCVRRQWRRTRGTTVDAMKPIKLPAAADAWSPVALLAAAGSLPKEVGDKANAGDAAALQAVNDYLSNPAARLFHADVGRQVLSDWARLYAGRDAVVRRAIFATAADLWVKLAGPQAGALDFLLAERVVTAWLLTAVAEHLYAATVDDLDARAAEHVFRRIEMGNRLLMTAARTLAKVRQCRLPEVLALVNVNTTAG